MAYAKWEVWAPCPAHNGVSGLDWEQRLLTAAAEWEKMGLLVCFMLVACCQHLCQYNNTAGWFGQHVPLSRVREWVDGRTPLVM
jgi:hypothetical protein